ncbi:MAG: purine-nucleoside phosphorylase [Bacteroidota bacterium]
MTFGPSFEDSTLTRTVDAAVSAIRATEDRVPAVAMVLGSGLGALADALDDAQEWPTQDLPGYPASTVEGHAGRVLIGTLEGVTVLVIRGRLHYYEGHSIRSTTFPIRLAYALGARKLLVTNAAGGINRRFRPGTLMFITDHLNLGWTNSLIGPNSGEGPRFPDMSNPYDADWLAKAEEKALELGIATERGVYLWTQGPSYETKAEIRFFERIGADAVGMSTVPEVIEAVYLGMKVLGVSTITNHAAGIVPGELNHEEVMEVGAMVRTQLERLVRGVLEV